MPIVNKNTNIFISIQIFLFLYQGQDNFEVSKKTDQDHKTGVLTILIPKFDKNIK